MNESHVKQMHKKSVSPIFCIPLNIPRIEMGNTQSKTFL